MHDALASTQLSYRGFTKRGMVCLLSLKCLFTVFCVIVGGVLLIFCGIGLVLFCIGSKTISSQTRHGVAKDIASNRTENDLL